MRIKKIPLFQILSFSSSIFQIYYMYLYVLVRSRLLKPDKIFFCKNGCFFFRILKSGFQRSFSIIKIILKKGTLKENDGSVSGKAYQEKNCCIEKCMPLELPSRQEGIIFFFSHSKASLALYILSVHNPFIRVSKSL